MHSAPAAHSTVHARVAGAADSIPWLTPPAPSPLPQMSAKDLHGLSIPTDFIDSAGPSTATARCGGLSLRRTDAGPTLRVLAVDGAGKVAVAARKRKPLLLEASADLDTLRSSGGSTSGGGGAALGVGAVALALPAPVAPPAPDTLRYRAQPTGAAPAPPAPAPAVGKKRKAVSISS